MVGWVLVGLLITPNPTKEEDQIKRGPWAGGVGGTEKREKVSIRTLLEHSRPLVLLFYPLTCWATLSKSLPVSGP